MEHILSLSYGKDSLACLGAIELLGWKLDRIIHAELWATKTIPADLSPMIEFKKKADKVIKGRYGITVEHITADDTYEDIFFKICGRGKNKGNIYGFPCIKGNWCNSKLKVKAIEKCKTDGIQYIGIAADEPKRFKVLNVKKISPLKEIGWTEADARKWCAENDLLSPIYTTSSRGGCWFCHNQSIGQLRILRKNYPELWNILLKWDKVSPISFKPEHTVHDYERRFKAEDCGLIIPGDTRFRWKQIETFQMK